MVTSEETQEESSSSNNSDNADKHLIPNNHCDNNSITSEINHMIIKVGTQE